MLLFDSVNGKAEGPGSCPVDEKVISRGSDTNESAFFEAAALDVFSFAFAETKISTELLGILVIHHSHDNKYERR